MWFYYIMCKYIYIFMVSLRIKSLFGYNYMVLIKMNLSLLLFLIGILGFVLNRKNIILMIIAIEIMLLAVTVKK